ncbi:Zn-dependent hydrolase [Rhizobium tubonense]|uniref:Zn-dependent hydrolase n=1 Tax=Rhizobium tubonense TaxID=484088 RepID=A0A2W4EL28_9HYPH|nr:Zn-dependent hydrolase [Rhizobium tubonense]PZM11550.1 Zn-dependent hydrolase [Rhizobium tubonense]
MSAEARIHGRRLLDRLNAFAQIGATAAGGVNRQALTAEDREARALLARLARDRGFAVFQDDMANLFVRRQGRRAELPPFLIGSHLDSQPTGGRFDGALGTLSAFEVLEAIEDAAVETESAIEVVAWTNEEGSRFSPGAMGSMAFVGAADPSAWRDLRGSDGASLSEELAATLVALPEAEQRPVGMPISGYLELHLEQGPSLEKERIPIGIVTGVQGTRWLEVTVRGQAGHAGTTELAYRRDPMVATTVALEKLFAAVMPGDAAARLTVGRLCTFPGSINAIPEQVVFSVDLRHPDSDRLDEMEEQVSAVCAKAATASGCTVDIRRTFDMPSAEFPATMIVTLEDAARRLSIPFKKMISGAFHDALFLARVAPTGMIFVPCRDGLSHNEAEFVEPEDAILGAQLLLEATLAVTQST